VHRKHASTGRNAQAPRTGGTRRRHAQAPRTGGTLPCTEQFKASRGGGMAAAAAYQHRRGQEMIQQHRSMIHQHRSKTRGERGGYLRGSGLGRRLVVQCLLVPRQKPAPCLHLPQILKS
jgi:hypothetical protein